MPLPSNGRAVGIHGFCIREISYGSLVCSIDKNTRVRPCSLKMDKLILYTKLQKIDFKFDIKIPYTRYD